uniref:NADH dehydrogenase subunit 6 n=1 Tax=Boreoheptagyia kurobebrevis TaxID=2851578 RepID=UPI0020287C80|nr:NADH dehydrogenase subunit 6 [Boreoheptagyia kurobebrevis]UQJ73470.1 NADH dehydrogenase subunit 6 [Boreoheptagyia kurobebrevis]
MLQFIISFTSLITSTIFMQMKHPMAMGMMLLIQTLFICLITGNYSKTFWFSYVLFLIFLGGMLVLFIYVTSLASNEMFNFSMKIFILSLIFLFLSLMIMMIMDNSIISSFLSNNEMNSLINMKSFIGENTISLSKLYNFPTNMMTILLINYLFLTLIAVVKITDIFEGPLRPKY